MKTFKTLLCSAWVGIAPATAAWAAEGGRQDNSSAVIWGFLGFCALIIIAQLVPTIRELRQAARAEKERLAAPARIRE